MIVGSFVYLLVSTAFGLLISVFFNSQAAAFIGTTVLTVVPAILYSGYLTPVSSMDRSALLIAHAVPTFYYLRFLKGIFFKNAPALYLVKDLGVLVVFFVLLAFLSWTFFKKRES